jgi:hypothetical protein
MKIDDNVRPKVLPHLLKMWVALSTEPCKTQEERYDVLSLITLLGFVDGTIDDFSCASSFVEEVQRGIYMLGCRCLNDRLPENARSHAVV